MRTVAAIVFGVFVSVPSLAFAQLPSPLLTCWAFPDDPDVLMVCSGNPVPRPKVVSFGEASIGLSATGQDAQVWLRLTSTAEFDQAGITYTIYPEGQMPVTRMVTLYTPDHGPATVGIPLHDDVALIGQHLAFAIEVVFPRGRGMAGVTMRDPSGHATTVPVESTRR
jgi:hypothetical protein